MKRLTNIASISLVLALMVSAFPVSPPPRVSAIGASEWQAGRIIDDNIFTNKDSLSVAEIQGFLNAKVPVCDTNGTQPTSKWNASAGRYYTRAEWGALNGTPAPFTCLRDYYEIPKTQPSAGMPANNYGGKPVPNGAESAAQLIWNAAQKNNISPKVLLTTIQKESAGPLTVDDWPFQSQYTYAMGAHCPDSGPNGSANCDSNYAGFSIQINESAALFRYYLDNMSQPWWPYKKPGNNSVLWNVQSTGCGASNIFIQTMATAALYTYTPYQPNQAALNNMYGLGDNCSAYGNRNFWRIYNDWFGLTHASYASNSIYAKSSCNIPFYTSNLVGRLYNPEIKDYLFTTSQIEACLAIRAGYIWDGVVFKNFVPEPGTIPVYRLTGFGRHLFTSSDDLKQEYTNNLGYRYEGIAFYAKSEAAQNLPIYCLVRNDVVTYTSATGEKDLLESEGYINAGLAFYTEPISTEKSALYRLSRGAHRIYTITPHEKDVAQLFYGFSWETNSTTSVQTAPGTGLAPVYRLSAPDRHFYTTNRGERDMAVVFYGYISEGTEFYAFPTAPLSASPTYRLTDSQGNRLYTNSSTEKALAISNFGYQDESISWYIAN